GPDAIIDCLISGKSPAEWLEQRQDTRRTPVKEARLLDSLRAVDASGYLLYRVRRFGRALAGLGARLERTAPFPVAPCYRLFRDPFGPVALAQAIARDDVAGPVAGFTSLADEHRAIYSGSCS